MAVERTVRQVESPEEIWETTGSATIYVRASGVDGRDRSLKVGGRPGQKLRISEYDRIRNQERVMDDKSDVFTNGMLLRVDAEPDDENPNMLSPEDVLELFSARGDDFTSRVDKLNEYNVRRLIEVCDELDATNSQINFLKDTLAKKWPIGGEMPMYTELSALGQVASPTK
jgi:hypothetical protein